MSFDFQAASPSAPARSQVPGQEVPVPDGTHRPVRGSARLDRVVLHHELPSCANVQTGKALSVPSPGETGVAPADARSAPASVEPRPGVNCADTSHAYRFKNLWNAPPIGIGYVLWYARRVSRNPAKSIVGVSEADTHNAESLVSDVPELTGRQKLVLALTVA